MIQVAVGAIFELVDSKLFSRDLLKLRASRILSDSMEFNNPSLVN